MMGPDSDRPEEKSDLQGITPRIVKDIFETVAMAEEHLEFTIQVSYIEIYLEKLRDLFNR